MRSHPFRLKPPVLKLSENDVEAGCLDIFHLHDYWVVRLHAGTFKSADGKRWIKGVEKGTPDYVCLHPRHRAFLLEVKRPGGTLSPAQQDQIALLREVRRLPVAVVDRVESLSRFLALHEQPP